MAELDLPAKPAELLEAVRLPLGQYLGGEHEMRLGGSTALVARWRHRCSPDLELFVDTAAYVRLFRGEERFRADLELHAGGARHLAIESDFTRIVLADGSEISVFSGLSLTDHPLSDDTVRGTIVPLESTAEILAKKLYYRIIENVTLVPHDLYDLATAQRHDAAALQKALSTLTEGHLHDIDTELGYLPLGWIQRHREPIADPTHPENAIHVTGIVRRLIQEHLQPSRSRDDQPRGRQAK